MALQTSGPISLDNVQQEWDGSAPISLNEYYGVDDGVPTSGTISLSDFYGTSAFDFPQGSAFTGQVRLDNFGTPLFDYDYICTRVISQTAGAPPNNVGYVQFNLPNNTGPDTNRTAYPAIRGNALGLIGQYTVFRISGVSYNGSWSTSTLFDGDFGGGYTVTWFSNASAGEVMRHAEGSSFNSYTWF